MPGRRLFILAALLLPACVFAQLAPGKLLIATRKSRDTDLKQSVILLVQYDRESALGLIVNRRSDVPASEAFPELTNMKGGPVLVWREARLRLASGLCINPISNPRRGAK